MSEPVRADGILLTAHGSVEQVEELPEFLLRIRHGRPAPAGLVEELERRYRAIGGSPFSRVTREQAEALARRSGLPVFVGMRLWRPELTDALAEAERAGVRRLCVLPLAPFSVPVYFKAAEQALSRGGFSLRLISAEPYGTAPEFVRAQARQIAPYLERGPALLVMTAHSLPTAVLRAGDPYADLVGASARAIAAELGCAHVLAYQSQGADGGDWLGPDLNSVLARSKAEGTARVVVAPIGFMSEHVETLYDLDIEARARAAELGLAFERVPALNAAPALIDALAVSARRALFG